MDIEVQTGNILSKCVELLEANEPLEHCLNHGFSTLLFVGTPFAGKTTIIERFISDKSDVQVSKESGETFGLKFYYAHNNRAFRLGDPMSGPIIDRRTCHIWELSNGWLYPQLVGVALGEENLAHCSVIAVIDLTKPEEISSLLEAIVRDVDQHVTNVGDSSTLRTLNERAQQRAKHGNNPFKVPLLVVGTKYDEFQNMDSEVRKQIVVFLRAFSHRYGAQLLFSSCKSETLIKRLEAALDYLAFERDTTPGEDNSDREKTNISVSTNFSKPVMIPFGHDSMSKIGVTSYEDARIEFERLFPQQSLSWRYNPILSIDPVKDPNFAEPEIDKVLEYKIKMLSKESST